MGGKGQRQCGYANKTKSIGKKNKTNNNDAVDSINATTNNADARTNDAIRLTSGQQQVDADGTKVVADNTINAATNNAEPHTNNTVGPTPGKQRVDTDKTKVIADDTIGAMTNNADAHTNNSMKTAKTDSNALSTMNTSASEVVIERTNNAHITKEAEIEQQLCVKNLAVGRGNEEQDASIAKAIEVEQYFQLVSKYHVQLL
jgi:hypothetical protein